MAITKMRFQVATTWYTGTLNSSTGLYEVTVTAPSTVTAALPITAEATNSNGYVATRDTTVEVRSETTAPTISITSPTAGSWNSSARKAVIFTVTDSGTGVDLSTVRLVLDGTSYAYNAAGMSYTAVTNGYQFTYTPQSNLANGTHTAYVTAADNAGNSRTSATRTFYIDAAAARLTITSPAAGLMTQSAEVSVSGTVTSTVSGTPTVTVNGTAVTVTNGAFSTTVPLSEGSNTITITAITPANITTTTTRKVTRDSIAPVVTVTTPTEGSYVTENQVTVEGAVVETGTGLVSFTVGGVLVTPAEDGSFSVSLTLSDGAHTIEATAEDGVGLTHTVSRSFTVDATVPALSVTHPAGDIVTNRSTLTVTGTVGDTVSGLASLTVGGVAVTPDAAGNFSYSMEFPDGAHTVEVAARDRAGNTSAVTRRIRVDTLPPEFLSVEISPVLDATPIGQAFLLTVQLSPPDTPETLTGTFHGETVAFSAQGNGLYTAPLTRPESDAAGWAVSLTAADGAGNVTAWVRDYECGLGCRWDWTPADFLNAPDLNRVERNTEFLRRWMEQKGMLVGIEETIFDWAENSLPDHVGDFDRIRDNINALPTAFYRPADWRNIQYGSRHTADHQNAWEWDIHIMDDWLARADRIVVYSGTINSGMFPL